MEILLFGSGQSFTDDLLALSEKILSKYSESTIESGLAFLGKYICIKQANHPFIDILTSVQLSLS